MEIKTFFAQDAQGNALSLASVTVRVAGTATIADIFDEAGAAKENPFQATASGAIVFAAANGSYDVNVQWNGGIATRDIYGVQFFDPAEAAGSQFATAAQGAKADTALQDATAFATAAQGAKADTALQDATAFATAAQGAKADTAVQPSRSVSAGTGLTGGGDLTANRTISASIATQAEAEAGLVTNKLMTPQRTAQAIAAMGAMGAQMQDFARVSSTGSIIHAGGGVSSVVKNGTGDYTVFFTTDLGSINQCTMLVAVENGYWVQNYNIGSSQIRLFTYGIAGTIADRTFNILRLS